MVLLAWYKKASAVIINSGEKSNAMNDNIKFPPTVKYVVVFGLIFFTVREYGNDLVELTKPIYEWIGDKLG
jgi:hypothetical protein